MVLPEPDGLAVRGVDAGAGVQGGGQVKDPASSHDHQPGIHAIKKKCSITLGKSTDSSV